MTRKWQEDIAVNVSLTPELEKLVHDKVASGLYQTASEVVREGLRLIEERDKRKTEQQAWWEYANEKIERGLEDIEAGRVYSGDEVKAWLLNQRRKRA